MAYSASDFSSSIVNHFFENGLISPAVAESDDLEHQATAVMVAISGLVKRAAEPLALAAGTTIPRTSQGIDLATEFMGELLDANETLTGVADEHGSHTLADCMYLLSAIQKGTSIAVEHPSESRVADVVKALPSGALWMTYVNEVTE